MHLVELLELYKGLVANSPEGDLYWSQSRELYLDGKAMIVIWSPSILDELGDLRAACFLTIEMPFKDNAERPCPREGWGTRHSVQLGQSTRDAIANHLSRT